MTAVTRLSLAPDAWLELDVAWLHPALAEALHATLRDELAWEQREVVIFGKPVLQPRLIAWAGARPYTYSRRTLPPRAFTPTVASLLARVNQRTGVAFDHVLVNRYRDGRDSMGMHADDEPELGPDPVVATLSLGQVRRFVLAPRQPSDGARRLLELPTGSLLVMGGACQRRFRHGLPRASGVLAERISLTFRRIVGP